MAGNKDDEHLGNSIISQSKKPSDEIISATKTGSIIPNQETENMEVHHHPHVEKKNFKEYFLEFLMIFLAVTMGFFAESLREHIVNKGKETEYMKSMLQDLKTDTAQVKVVIAFQQLIYRKIDSALNIPAEKLKNIETQDSFYHHFVFFYSWLSTFNRVGNTISQLKNAGGFSLINNKIVKDSITKLNSFYEGYFLGDMNIYVSRWQRIDEFAMQLMILPRPPALITDSLYNILPHHTEFFIRYDYPLLQQLYSFIRFEQSDIEILLFQDNQYLNEAVNLINLIKNQYDFQE